MSMTPSRIQELTLKRKTLASDPSNAGLVQQIDQMLRAATGAKPTVTTRRPRRDASAGEQFETVSKVARIPNGDRCEIQVEVKRHRTVNRVDVRLWFVPAGATEFAPSRKGLLLGAEQVSAVIAALQEARSFLPPTAGKPA